MYSYLKIILQLEDLKLCELTASEQISIIYVTLACLLYIKSFNKLEMLLSG